MLRFVVIFSEVSKMRADPESRFHGQVTRHMGRICEFRWDDVPCDPSSPKL
jgi:hypothetical protein